MPQENAGRSGEPSRKLSGSLQFAALAIDGLAGEGLALLHEPNAAPTTGTAVDIGYGHRGRRPAPGLTCGSRLEIRLAELKQPEPLAQPAQKDQNREGKLQLPPVPKDIACESEEPSQAHSERHQSDDSRDAPGSQNVPATARLLRQALLR